MDLRPLVVVCLFSSAALAAEPDCGVDEHESGGHCCRGGEEWVPAKRRCVCLDPDTCGGASAKKAAPAPKAKESDEPAGPSTLERVGQAFVAAVEFEDMVNKMRGMTTDFGRRAYAKELGAAKHRFTCEQISRLMAAAQIDSVACDIAGSLFPHATDPENFPTLMTGLKFPDLSQRRLKESCGKG
jgi:hypothetical protein